MLKDEWNASSRASSGDPEYAQTMSGVFADSRSYTIL